MSSPIWASHFGISESEIAKLKNQLPAQDNPLRWILVNGYIPSDDYVRWARDQYGLPSLREDYFNVPVDHVYWEAVKDVFPWSPSFFPLAEWQGVMIIGCIEPPSFHFPVHTPHRFVIATAHALEHRFRELEPTHVHAQPETHAEVRQRPADEVLAENLPPAPDVDLKDPDGLVGHVDVGSETNVNLYAVPDGMQVDDLGKPVPKTPDGLEVGTAFIDMDSLDFSQPDPSASAEVATAAKIQPEKPRLPTSAPSAVEAPPPRAPMIPPGPPAAAVAANATAKSEKIIMPPPPVSIISRSNVSRSELAVPLATCSTIDALTSAVITHLTMHFEHAVLFMFENSMLHPVKWSELLLSVKGENPDPISLEQPSIFRVAARTSLPYHGYMVTNPVNAAFLNAFNRGALPKHVTVMPVMIAGQLTAMLMGLSMGDVDYKASLVATEKIASDFSIQLERLRSREITQVA